jgi:hypothetical protein
VVKIISFLDLFPRMPDVVFRNLNKIKITISWNDSTDLLTYRGNDGTARVYLLKVDPLEDYYVPEPTTAIVETEQKINEQQPDIIPFVDPMVRAVRYTPGMQIPVAIAHNLESVMVFQLAKRQGNAVPAALTYDSHGQFTFVSNALGAAAIPTEADEPRAAPDIPNSAGMVAGITSIAISYNNQSYPQQLIQVGRPGAGADFAQLYYEYLKALDRFGHPGLSGAVPYEVFKTTMPFLWVRPYATDAPKLTKDAELIVNTTSDVIAETADVPNVVIIYFVYKVAKLTAAGGIEFAVQ